MRNENKGRYFKNEKRSIELINRGCQSCGEWFRLRQTNCPYCNSKDTVIVDEQRK
jgi:uncharacterized OB-fold protein